MSVTLIIDRDGVATAPGRARMFLHGKDLAKLIQSREIRSSFLRQLGKSQVCVNTLGILKDGCYQDADTQVQPVAGPAVLDYYAKV